MSPPEMTRNLYRCLVVLQCAAALTKDPTFMKLAKDTIQQYTAADGSIQLPTTFQQPNNNDHEGDDDVHEDDDHDHEDNEGRFDSVDAEEAQLAAEAKAHILAQSASILQHNVRQFRTQRYFQSHRLAATIIQTQWREGIFSRNQNMAILVQRVWL